MKRKIICLLITSMILLTGFSIVSSATTMSTKDTKKKIVLTNEEGASFTKTRCGKIRC